MTYLSKKTLMMAVLLGVSTAAFALVQAAAPPKVARTAPLPKIPADNPMTSEKIELGKMLYFDTRLSKDGTISCASCHNPVTGWDDVNPTSEGVGGKHGARNSQTVLNSAFAKVFFWDGRAATLEEQAAGPIENPVEMADKLDNVVAKLSKVPEYQKRFQAVFGTEVTADGITKAIAAFERTIINYNSPYDKYKAGDESAMSDSAKRGMELFTEIGCNSCHRPPYFSTSAFVNTGVGMDAKEPDVGRFEWTQNERDYGAFRIPTLRNVAETAPYFHDGKTAELRDAVQFMVQGGLENDNRSPMLVGTEVTEEELTDLVEFLKSLSGEPIKMETPQLP
ncbi:MAG: cytochrome c peroxidase [Thermoguttaceae bacterium]|nr:cytochrome c peroxidase [Thermoguttaceae bacterium]